MRQCALTGLCRQGLYYQARGESLENLHLMRSIDEQYTRHPFYGVERMTYWLRQTGWWVNPKRVRRLMRQMDLEAIYPKPRLSEPGRGHQVYPYRLNGLKIERANQVWASDITYIRMRRGFIYLVAIMDWYSRYVVSWEISTSLDVSFCLAALEWALQTAHPEIFNSDQGAQFTSEKFTSRLEHEGILISMDGRGRVTDNIFVERLWRTVKYEEVYLKDYQNVPEAIASLGDYFRFYNRERPHQALANQTPAAVYFGQKRRAAGAQKLAMLWIVPAADRGVKAKLARNVLENGACEGDRRLNAQLASRQKGAGR